MSDKEVNQGSTNMGGEQGMFSEVKEVSLAGVAGERALKSKRVARFFMDSWEGLRCGLVPMLGKEMRGRTRGLRSPVLLSVYLGVLIAGVLLFLWLTLERMNYIMPQVGLSLYTLFIFSLVMLISFIAPAIAASTISGERERRTYDLLLVTKASLAGIVLGKWLASVVYLMFLAVAALPVFAVVFFFGGVPPAILGLAFVVCLAAGLGYGALGLALSALLRRSQAATIVSLILVFLFTFGVPVIAGIIMSGNQGMPGSYDMPPTQATGPPWYVFISPLTAFTSVLPGTGEYDRNWGIPVISELMNMILNRMRMGDPEMVYAYKMGYAYPGGSELKLQGLAAWAPWARFALYQGFLTLLSLVVAVLVIAPLKPWTTWRTRRKQRRVGQLSN
jgi:ABC-type transport system involved in multi-copper enzyme maturation permease subunit